MSEIEGVRQCGCQAAGRAELWRPGTVGVPTARTPTHVPFALDQPTWLGVQVRGVGDAVPVGVCAQYQLIPQAVALQAQGNPGLATQVQRRLKVARPDLAGHGKRGGDETM